MASDDEYGEDAQEQDENVLVESSGLTAGKRRGLRTGNFVFGDRGTPQSFVFVPALYDFATRKGFDLILDLLELGKPGYVLQFDKSAGNEDPNFDSRNDQDEILKKYSIITRVVNVLDIVSEASSKTNGVYLIREPGSKGNILSARACESANKYRVPTLGLFIAGHFEGIDFNKDGVVVARGDEPKYAIRAHYSKGLDRDRFARECSHRLIFEKRETKIDFGELFLKEFPAAFIATGESDDIFDSAVDCLRKGRPLFALKGTGAAADATAALIEFGKTDLAQPNTHKEELETKKRELKEAKEDLREDLRDFTSDLAGVDDELSRLDTLMKEECQESCRRLEGRITQRINSLKQAHGRIDSGEEKMEEGTQDEEKGRINQEVSDLEAKLSKIAGFVNVDGGEQVKEIAKELELQSENMITLLKREIDFQDNSEEEESIKEQLSGLEEDMKKLTELGKLIAEVDDLKKKRLKIEDVSKEEKEERGKKVLHLSMEVNELEKSGSQESRTRLDEELQKHLGKSNSHAQAMIIAETFSSFAPYFNPTANLTLDMEKSVDPYDLQDDITKVLSTAFDDIPELGSFESDKNAIHRAEKLILLLKHAYNFYSRRSLLLQLLISVILLSTTTLAIVQTTVVEEERVFEVLSALLIVLPLLGGVCLGVNSQFRLGSKAAAALIGQKRIEAEISRYMTRTGLYQPLSSVTPGEKAKIRKRFSDTCNEIFDACLESDLVEGRLLSFSNQENSREKEEEEEKEKVTWSIEDDYVQHRLSEVILKFKGEIKKWTRWRFTLALSRVTLSAVAAAFAAFSLQVWIPVALSLEATVEAAYSFFQLDTRVSNLNRSVGKIEKAMSDWEGGLSLVEKRMTVHKDKFVDACEDAILAGYQQFADNMLLFAVKSYAHETVESLQTAEVSTQNVEP